MKTKTEFGRNTYYLSDIEENESFFAIWRGIFNENEGNYVIHYHNWFDQNYKKYRADYQGDLRYIRKKRKKEAG